MCFFIRASGYRKQIIILVLKTYIGPLMFNRDGGFSNDLFH